MALNIVEAEHAKFPVVSLGVREPDFKKLALLESLYGSRVQRLHEPLVLPVVSSTFSSIHIVWTDEGD